MAPRGMITVTTALLCIIVGLLSPAPATCYQSSNKCCVKHTRSEVPVMDVRGLRVQRATENCRIEAIIFYMADKSEVCASQRDAWVRKALALFSYKLRKMSKGGSPAAGAKKKSGQPSLNTGTGSFVSTTEPFLNNMTTTFYF
ncbi:hypothetical protein INR49_010518 [Caranx melampygus]|nr:hypothetical protein INR49_010518 [Caranx melampygus]